MPGKFYTNVSEVSVGDTGLTGVQSVGCSEAAQPESLYGDGDIIPVEVRNHKRTVTTTIVTNDLSHGIRVSDSFVKVAWTSLEGADQNLTQAFVANDGVVTGVNFNAAHNGRASSTITIQHTAADGLTSPLSIS